MRLRGWNGVEAGKALGVSNATISHWRRGHRVRKRETMVFVTHLLDAARCEILADLEAKVNGRTVSRLPMHKESIIAELRDAGGSDWDKIDDPEAYIREVTC